MCYHIEFCHFVLQGVDINTREPPKLVSAEVEYCSLGLGGVADSLVHTPPTCVTTSNLVVLQQIVHAWIERDRQNWRALEPRTFEVGAWLTPRNAPLPHTCYPIEFGRSRSSGTSVVKEIRLKILTPLDPPFKVTQGHRNRYVSIRHHDFLLTLRIATTGLSCTVSGINGISVDNRKFSHFRVFYAPVGGFPLELGTDVGNQKTTMTLLRRGLRKKFDDIFGLPDTIHEGVSRTVSHRPTAKTALTHSVAR